MLLAVAGRKTTSICTVLFALFAVTGFAQQDPPSRVARLNYVNGNVSMEPSGIDEWAPAAINRPFTTGDYLYADQKSVAELHMDVAAIRIGEVTSFGFLNLDDQVAQLKLTEGDMYFRIHNLDGIQTFQIDTPNAAITFLRDGVYRVHVDPNANSTFVVVRNGQAQITGGGQAFTLNPGNSASLSGTDELAYNVEDAPAPDVFDTWCEQRDAHEERPQSARYLPPTVIGSEDLDDNGVWSETPDYGAVWYPRQVDAGWAPYHNGHWAWIEPWGWTWVDDAPWGFAPFHYGRWVYWHERWGWAPGPIAVVGFGRPVPRPIYSPALVAWFGGGRWNASVSLGGGPSLGWVALGFGEVFTPHYACSRQYFSNVNVNNTRIERNVNITNVYNNVYVNHTVYDQKFVNVRSPNAVVSMPQSAFANGRSVRQAGMSVRPNELARFRPAESAMTGPGIAPTRQGVASSLGQQAAHPSAQIAQRQVLARNTPPPPPASFASRQAYIQQHAAQPHNFAAMHQAIAPSAKPVAMVRQIPAGQPVAARPGRSVGNVTAAPSPAARPSVAPQGYPARQERSMQRVPEQQMHQNPPSPAGHGTPPNLHQGYNAQAAPKEQPYRPNDRSQRQPRLQEQPQPQNPESAHPARNEEPNTQRVSPRVAEQPRYAAPSRAPAYETMRPAEPRRAAEPPHPVERNNQPEARPQSRPEPHSEAHGDSHQDSHHDDKK